MRLLDTSAGEGGGYSKKCKSRVQCVRNKFCSWLRNLDGCLQDVAYFAKAYNATLHLGFLNVLGTSGIKSEN